MELNKIRFDALAIVSHYYDKLWPVKEVIKLSPLNEVSENLGSVVQYGKPDRS